MQARVRVIQESTVGFKTRWQTHYALLGNFAEYERLPVRGVYLYASKVKLKRPAWVY